MCIPSQPPVDSQMGQCHRGPPTEITRGVYNGRPPRMVGGVGGWSEGGTYTKKIHSGFGPEGRKILSVHRLRAFLRCLGGVWRRKNAKIFSPSGGPSLYYLHSLLKRGRGARGSVIAFPPMVHASYAYRKCSDVFPRRGSPKGRDYRCPS